MTDAMERARERVVHHVERLRSLGAKVDLRQAIHDGQPLVVRVESGSRTGDLAVWPNGYVSRLILDGVDFAFEDDKHCNLPATEEIDEFFRAFEWCR
jgi:hypothetical protein